MLYLIGLGLNEKGISIEGREALKICSKTYLEAYTVDFPYSISELGASLKVKIIELKRAEVESSKLIEEAKKENIALLVYGSPLFATTHLSLIIEAKKSKVQVKMIHSSSIFEVVSESGLELYKFGKITSMPGWKGEKFKPDSFLDIVKANLSINAHSLILCDIGLSFQDSLRQLEESLENKQMKIDKIIVCSNMGNLESIKKKILYGTINKLDKEKIENPFCLIIPSKELHFTEKEALNSLEI